MKRTKTSQRIVKMANNIIVRPSIWVLSRTKDSIDKLEKRIFTYGDSRVVVHGRLFEEDRGVFLCLLELAKQNDYKKFDFKISDIAKVKGKLNPYQESAQQPIRDSLERLLDSHIRIRPTKGKGLSAGFKLVSGYLDSDDVGQLSVTPYLDKINELGLGVTSINLDKYLEPRSQVARSLYSFLDSQRPFYQDKQGYEIRLTLLLKHLNYDVKGRPLWRIWPTIKMAIEELKQNGFIKRYRYDKTRHKGEGGVIKFLAVRKGKTKELIGSPNDPWIELIKTTFDDKVVWGEGVENQFRTALNKIEVFLETDLKSTCSMKMFMDYYCSWLELKNLKFIAPTLFKTNNSFFMEFVKQHSERGEILFIEEKYKYKHKDDVDVIIKKQPSQHRINGKKKKKQKCPSGYQLGKDFNKYDECFDCELYDKCNAHASK